MKVLDIRVITLAFVLSLKAANGNAQSLSLDQLISVYQTEYFSDIDTYMRKIGWKFDDGYGQVYEGKEADKFAWVHSKPDGYGNDATFIVVFCKNSDNKFCREPTRHSDKFSEQQALENEDAIRLLYIPTTSQAFLQIKRSAEKRYMVAASTQDAWNMHVVYVGANYELETNEYSNEENCYHEYSIELVRKSKSKSTE